MVCPWAQRQVSEGDQRTERAGREFGGLPHHLLSRRVEDKKIKKQKVPGDERKVEGERRKGGERRGVGRRGGE